MKLDRFARSTKDALNTIEYLNSKGVALIVLNMGGDKIDTSTGIGKLMITVLSGRAEFEADTIKERQLEGIEEAKKEVSTKGGQRNTRKIIEVYSMHLNYLIIERPTK